MSKEATLRNKERKRAKEARRRQRLALTRSERKFAKRMRWIKRGGAGVINWLRGKGKSFAEEHSIDPSTVAGYSDYLNVQAKLAKRKEEA
jgi:hypothetical protein